MLNLAVPQEDSQLDFTSLAHLYLGHFVDLDRFLAFLNTTQTGSAHLASGTDPAALMHHIGISLGICVIQMTLFCYLRPYLRSVYLPRCYFAPKAERMDPVSRGFFDWVLPSWRTCDLYYTALGLDSLFFIRFLRLLVLFFGTIGLVNLLVLVPINVTGNNEYDAATGLDRMSVLNVAPSKIRRLNAHIICCLLTLATIIYLIHTEMANIARIRVQHFQLPKYRSRESARALLLGPVPPELRQDDKVKQLFTSVSGGVHRVCFFEDFRNCAWHAKRILAVIDILEEWMVAGMGRNKPPKEFYPPTFLPFMAFGMIPQLPQLKKRRPRRLAEWAAELLEESFAIITKKKQEVALEQSEQQETVFLVFNDPEGARVALQCLLSGQCDHFTTTVSDVDRRDIAWGNLLSKTDPIRSFLFSAVICFLEAGLVVVYVVPVSLISLLSHTPVMVKLFPLMGSFNHLPGEVRETFSSIFPAFALSVLTELQVRVFRQMAVLKGYWTGKQVELDTQRWHFCFLFTQQFLVVSILSSLFVVLIQIIEKPGSIPMLMAANLPKSATFFFKFFTVKIFSFCSSSFVRGGSVLVHAFHSLCKDRTPRQKFRRLTSLPRVRWGSVYPTITVYGCIGITYCVISPMISLFVIIVLFFVLLYYKYALRYVYHHVTPAETHGILYSRALFQLYAGIYCLELCMIGICFSLRDEANGCPMRYQGLVMVLAFLMTLAAHIWLYQRFLIFFKHSPIGGVFPKETSPADLGSLSHPCYLVKKPIIWLPEDNKSSIQHYREEIFRFPIFSGFSTHGATITWSKIGSKIEVCDGEPCPAESDEADRPIGSQTGEAL